MLGDRLGDEIKQQTINAYQEYGSFANAARALNMPVSTFKSRYKVATLDGSVANLEPFIPEGQKLRGVSTLYNSKGEKVIQWVKTNGDLQRQLDLMIEAAESLKADIPKDEPQVFTGSCNNDLLSLYILTDYHLGQLSCKAETGEGWNTGHASEFLVRWFANAITSAPPSEIGVLCNLGDFLHFDGLEPVTPTSKHVLDADVRYAELVSVAVKAIRRIVQMMLKKHKRVHIIMAEGNHDLASSVWLRALFADKYENEPRITVDNTRLPYYAYEWGETSLFFHHGHKKRLRNISGAFAGIYRDIFGRTKYSYAHMGHLHHVESKEDSLMIVEQHPTLAAKDAHSARGAYNSNRGASVISYHRRHGEVSRITIRPEMIDGK